MIGYSITLQTLKADIETECPGWLKRAEDRTEEFRTQGRYEETSSIWSEVKAVHMRLQGASKCIYCERKLEAETLGKGEQAVEHFRPKARVRAWKAPKALTQMGISFTRVPDKDHGYYLLPYHPFNYSASCIPCNTALKRDYFPIAGKYTLTGKDPRQLLNEKPYLIYPLGDFDDNPEGLIRFHGLSPQAIARKGHKRDRAVVTIAFFRLDDENDRDNLFRERAIVIIALYPQLQIAHGRGTAANKAEAQSIIDGFQSSKSAHTNCARSFCNLFKRDPTEAQAVFDRTCAFFITKS
jgi:hypothetical protein